MDIKERKIQMGKMKSTEVDCIIINEYGIEDGDIYHREITIKQNLYEAFEMDPDDEMLLDKFLEHNNINGEWKHYMWTKPRENQSENHTLADSSNLLDVIDFDRSQIDITQQTEAEVNESLYNELSKKKTLINNPLILAVFNEAIRGKDGLSNWENVFPFFK